MYDSEVWVWLNGQILWWNYSLENTKKVSRREFLYFYRELIAIACKPRHAVGEEYHVSYSIVS